MMIPIRQNIDYPQPTGRFNTFHPGPAGEEAVFSDQNSSFPYLPDYLGSARKHQTFG
jgi:hypothetical protein